MGRLSSSRGSWLIPSRISGPLFGARDLGTCILGRISRCGAGASTRRAGVYIQYSIVPRAPRGRGAYVFTCNDSIQRTAGRAYRSTWYNTLRVPIYIR